MSHHKPGNPNPHAKKESPQHRRWNLAKGGTNVLMPRGSRVEPWPKWLTKNFVNIHFLQEDPIELRQELFGGMRHPNDTWGLVTNLLYALEEEATKILKEDDRRFIGGLSEDQFDGFYFGQSNTTRQANAIAALRSIEIIRSKTNTIDNHGYLMSDPHHDHTYESLTVANIIMEVAVLMIAAIRGEIWENHTLTEKGKRFADGPTHSRRKDLLNKEICDAIKALGGDTKPQVIFDYLRRQRRGKGCISEDQKKIRCLSYIPQIGAAPKLINMGNYFRNRVRKIAIELQQTSEESAPH